MLVHVHATALITSRILAAPWRDRMGWRKWIWRFYLSGTGCLFVTDYFGSIIRVDGVSMQPTLNPEGSPSHDWVLVEKFSVKLFHQYHRGDVVVLWWAEETAGRPPARVRGRATMPRCMHIACLHLPSPPLLRRTGGQTTPTR